MKYWFVLFFLVSCAGYRFTKNSNPLSQYGIESLSIPMFYNYSSLPQVSHSFTRETYKLISNFSGLKVMSGYSRDSDAVLVGIIKSDKKLSKVLKTTDSRVAQTKAGTSIGNTREDFYIPGITRVDLMVQVIIIKKPSEAELALLRSELGDKAPLSSKVIFNETFNVNDNFIREVLDGAGTQVVGTQNDGILKKTTNEMAFKTAQDIRDMILYVF